LSEVRDFLEQTEAGRDIARRNQARGFAQGLAQALGEKYASVFVAQIEVVYAETRADSMRILLRAAFGEIDDLDDLARRFAHVGYENNVCRIVAGATIDEMRLIR
jgi:hypothetical protein